MINLRHVYDALKGHQIGDFCGYGDVDPLACQIARDVSPAWYVLQIVPAHERIAAGHLVERRFGIFLPEVETITHARGVRRRALLPMFPGYMFIFTWLSPANYHRVRDCPGVWDFLCEGADPAVISDAAIDAVRAVENKQRPLVIAQEGIGMPRKIKRRWRRRSQINDHLIGDNEIVAVHTWSALRDNSTNSVDSGKRTQALLRALGLA